jgi:hypothetical protein
VCALVTLGTDLRLRLGTLAGETGAVFGDLAVERLADGCVELPPAEILSRVVALVIPLAENPVSAADGSQRRCVSPPP